MYFNVITKFEITEPMILKAFFADGEIVSLNINEVIKYYDKYSLLKDFELFKTAKKDPNGYMLIWNDDLDISSNMIYEEGKHIGKCEPDINILVAEKLQNERYQKQMSQRELSARSGVLQPEIAKIEKRKGNPTIKTIQKLASALGVQAYELLK